MKVVTCKNPRWLGAAATIAALAGAVCWAPAAQAAPRTAEGTYCTGATGETYSADGSVWTKAEACYKIEGERVYPVYRFECQYKWGGAWYAGETCSVRLAPQIASNSDHQREPQSLVTGSGTGTFDVAGTGGMACSRTDRGITIGGKFNADQYWTGSDSRPNGDLPVGRVDSNICS
ncbi:hypothetical protein ABZ763_12885 [Streptomyces bacillaris]|uniref:hypothetical protein n=1 Tax=Streptomyces bacillaris TaxID=68179 RepID=UPI0034606C73